MDWELWLPVKGEPLPKRSKTVQRPHRPAADRHDVHELESRAADRRRQFTPDVPADYEGIAILQRAAAVKNAAAATPSPGSQIAPVKK